jgi:uncharacterized Zn ribbon protein
MHPEINKLIEIAKSGESISDRQKEIILNKAKLLGDDLDEVEMILETTFKQPAVSIKSQRTERKKCPNCGKIVDDLSLFCPDCGYSFNTESSANKDVADILDSCSKAIKNADEHCVFKELKEKELKESGKKKLDEYEESELDYQSIVISKERKISAIRSLSVPYTFNALVQAFEYCYGLFQSSNKFDSNEHEFCTACFSKSKELYSLIKAQEKDDPKISAWVKAHSFIEKEKPKSDGTGVGCLISFLFCLGTGAGLFFLIRSCSQMFS